MSYDQLNKEKMNSNKQNQQQEDQQSQVWFLKLNKSYYNKYHLSLSSAGFTCQVMTPQKINQGVFLIFEPSDNQSEFLEEVKNTVPLLNVALVFFFYKDQKFIQKIEDLLRSQNNIQFETVKEYFSIEFDKNTQSFATFVKQRLSEYKNKKPELGCCKKTYQWFLSRPTWVKIALLILFFIAIFSLIYFPASSTSKRTTLARSSGVMTNNVFKNSSVENEKTIRNQKINTSREWLTQKMSIKLLSKDMSDNRQILTDRNQNWSGFLQRIFQSVISFLNYLWNRLQRVKKYIGL